MKKLPKIAITNLMQDNRIQSTGRLQNRDDDKPAEFFLDKIGLYGYSCNEITLMKFLTIEEQLNKKPSRSKTGEDSVASEHPLQRLNKKFNQYLH